MNVWVPISPFLFIALLYSLSLNVYRISSRHPGPICETNLHVIYIAKFFIVIRHIAKRRDDYRDAATRQWRII